MYKKSILITLVLFAVLFTDGYAQGLLGKLTQKVKQVGEQALDKAIDNVLKPAKVPNKDNGSTVPEKGTNNTSPPVNSGNQTTVPIVEGLGSSMIKTDTLINGIDTIYHFNTSSISAKEFVSYALTLKGTPYVYGSSDPAYGLDCSGLITHVFNHFNIAVPRRTFDFKNAEKKVPVKEAKPGDIILFTGPDIGNKVPGHMGIVVSVGKDIQFIHASSGQSSKVTTAQLSYNYFKSRFLNIVRVF